jgi:N-acetylglucosaminyldiphosphoundecaprenol N-acetyl-beta-D-mannosaminyltransferase
MSQPPVPRYNVLGIGVSTLGFTPTRDAIIATRGHLYQGYVCLGTAHGFTLAQRDPALKAAYRGAWLTTPDGMPLVWLGPPGTERVYGPDLLLAVCDAGRAVGLRHYFYGGAPGGAETLREKLTARFPGLDVAGTFSPPYRAPTADELSKFRAEITRLRPDVIWIGLGTPKQEKFMAAHAATLDAAVLIGVGAAFDFHSGRIRQAPRWLQRSGFEWFFRLCTEPRRLTARYLFTNPLFVLHVLLQRTGLKKYPLAPSETNSREQPG